MSAHAPNYKYGGKFEYQFLKQKMHVNLYNTSEYNVRSKYSFENT